MSIPNMNIDTPNQQTPLEKAKVNDIDLGCSVPNEPAVANEGSIRDLLKQWTKILVVTIASREELFAS